MLKVTSTRVYDLAEAVVASGFPMLSEYREEDFENNVISTGYGACSNDTCLKNEHFARAVKLASASDGSGHRTFLSGVLVCMNITATIKWWVQFGRYHFQQIDSSMSTMHRLKKMSNLGTIQFHEKTDPRFIKLLDDLIAENADEETIIYSCPGGLELTARVNTNYLQLRSMMVQRQNHKLQEWHVFCDWIAGLPFAEQFIVSRKKVEK